MNTRVLHTLRGVLVFGGVLFSSAAFPAKFADFDGDGKSDIFWRHTGGGESYIYPMNGTAILGTEGYVRTVADPDWQVVGIADFNGDGKADILWRNVFTGDNYIYLMSGTTIAGEGYIRMVADQNWQVVGVGDFNGDGKEDILWRNQATGDNYIYHMDGTTIVGEGYIRTVADQNWVVAGVGDFDHDGKADILWRNTSTGENYIYLMNGTTIAGEGYIRSVADQNWQVAGVADFNGDGKADILWRRTGTGETYIYLMNATTIAGEGYVRTVADLNWRIVGVGDYNGDGNADILWHNVFTGENYVYPMSGTTILAGEGFTRTVADTRWHPIAHNTPVALAQVEVQRTLSATKSVINSRGAALDYIDLQPLYDSANFLGDGLDWAYDAGSLADGFRGTTVLSFVRGKLVSYDAANRIIRVAATLGFDAGAGMQTAFVPDDDPLVLKRQADGSWRFFGNLRPGQTTVLLEMRTDQLCGGPPSCASEIKTGPRAYIGVDFRPPVNSITGVSISGGPFNAAALARNSIGGTFVTETLSLQASPPPANPVDYVRDIWVTGADAVADQQTAFTFTATPASGPQKTFKTVPRNSPTTDNAFALIQPDATKHALANANLGSPLNMSWTNPTQFTVVRIRIFGEVTTAHFQCTKVKGLTAGATSGAMTLPMTCGMETVTSAIIEVLVQGPNGERGHIVYGFGG